MACGPQLILQLYIETKFISNPSEEPQFSIENQFAIDFPNELFTYHDIDCFFLNFSPGENSSNNILNSQSCTCADKGLCDVSGKDEPHGHRDIVPLKHIWHS